MRFTCTAALTCFALSSSALSQVSGLVLDSQSLQPIAGAHVRVQTTQNLVLTTANGAFTLPVNPGANVVVAAALPGYWNTSQQVTAPISGITLLLDLIPQGDDPNEAFQSPANCFFCHQSVFNEWDATPMSLSGTNQWLHDVYAGNGSPGGSNGFVYVNDSVHKTTNPDGDCASCHAPVLAAKNPGGNNPLGDPANPPAEQLEGVSCDLCHRMESVDLNFMNHPGIVPEKVRFRRPTGLFEPIMFGPLDDAVYSASGSMKPAWNPLFETAQICAVCHQDQNDHDDDGDYEEAGSVPHQDTYREWLNSPYAQAGPGFMDCKDCHMVNLSNTSVCIFGPNRDPSTIHSHEFYGTTPMYLENAVELKLRATLKQGRVRVQVDLTNVGAGHAVPTGSDFRNLILLVTAIDKNGNDLSYHGPSYVHRLAGLGNPKRGNYGGQPGKLYAKINTSGTANAIFFSEATAIHSDNRLLPLQTDTTQYFFKAPPTGDIIVRAKLLYRRAWKYLTDVKDWTKTGMGEPNPDVTPPHFGYLMESERVLLKGP